MRVLLADDDDVYRHAIRKTLEGWGYRVTSVGDGREAMRLLTLEDRPNLVILDWMMPGMDGMDILCRVRAAYNVPYVYILLATARDGKADMIAGMEAQADDYLVKPFDLRELRARLQAGRRIVELQDALASRQQELSHQATHDPLTGIWNRTAVLDILEREASSSRSRKTPLCLALADIDHFKEINDTYGHVSGDAVLIEVTRRIQSSVRRYDTFGRYGGDEFLLVVPGLDALQARYTAERIRIRVAAQPCSILEQEIRVTLSMGISAHTGAGSAASLLQAADEALYRAKARGRNSVELARGGADNVRLFPQRNSG